jgi:hypothetical protein
MTYRRSRKAVVALHPFGYLLTAEVHAMSHRSKPCRAPGIETHQSGEELLVHDTRAAKVHVLNPTAAAIFSLCDGSHDVEAIVTSVAGTWSAEHNLVEADVARMLAEFRALALLEPDATSSTT